jgi:UDP-N-acetylmuramoyl-L-alanyl-D-glutamate--2,6-diaminopimelate ligase
MLPLLGRWNVSNALAAAAAAGALGLGLDDIATGLGKLTGVPGRMQPVQQGQPFQVIVDYAHTAPALALVLSAAREAARGRVLVMFGSAGERDIEKRAEMGAIAARCANYSIFTSEDPRFEPPDAIIDSIATGATQSGAVEGVDFDRLEDRGSAIARILGRARAGDVVILAGKGHERSMLYGAEARPWDEVEIARNTLRHMGYTESV